MEKFEGTVVDILFSNDSNGYTVAKLKIEEDIEVITGCMPGLTSGENIEVEGSWIFHESYGKQISVKAFKMVMPTSISGIISFLSSGVITGVGEKLAKRITDEFGISTLDVLQNRPEELLRIEGIGKRKLKPIIESFNENMGIKNVIIALSEFGITPNMSIKIYKKYGDGSLEIIKNNPYALIDVVVGIGFKTADEIARHVGLEKDSEFRIQQGIMHILKSSISSGHTFLPEEILRRESANLLEIDVDLIDEYIFELALERKIILEKYGDYVIVYLAKYHRAEVDVATDIIRFVNSEHKDVLIDIDDEIAGFEDQENIELASEQKMAVKAAFENGIMVLTGGPGTGKTTTINTIINLFKVCNKKVMLAAPTGRAAKRMTETTGDEAKTIHRLLEMSFDNEDFMYFAKNQEEPIDADVVIVDEASMIDIFLMDSLLKAIAKKTRLILVGDADQLPSVGAGNVLADIISSGIVTTIRLTEIFRQAQESDIIVNAHRINQGLDIVANIKGSDFFFINKDSEEEIVEEVKSLVGGRLESFYKVDSLKEIQILSPMRKGIAGVNNLNIELQKVLNPEVYDRMQVKLMKRIFRVGDKVMQIKNNYSKKWENEKGTDYGDGIYNGDIGYVYHIDKNNNTLYVIFDEYKIFKYKFDELEELEHCFCTTVHKSQGSEFPVVIIPMTWGPPSFLSRNLLYTAVTRAKKLVVVVGMKKYMDYMISNKINNDRYSNLGYKLSTFRLNNIID